ncbi:MAG: hypoxanthine phosphoribosyltransferase [Candidatus Wallbacteria bacterium]
MNKKIAELKIETLISETDIKKRIKIMADQINNDYKDQSVYLICVLKGAFVFATDLCRQITVPCECGFMAVSSYGNAKKSSGKVKITKDLDEDIENKNVIIIEDIVDTGITLNFLKEYISTRQPKSLKICSLLSKPSCRKLSINIDYIGFEIEDKFVIGYGLDYEQYYRNLPYVAIVKN